MPCRPVDFKKVPCRPVDFKKGPCRPVDFKKVPCRMLLKHKKGRVTMSILGVHTYIHANLAKMGLFLRVVNSQREEVVLY